MAISITSSLVNSGLELQIKTTLHQQINRYTYTIIDFRE